MTRIMGAWVVLTIKPSHLEFRMRFRLLARLFGPWRLERAAVRDVYPGRLHALDPWGRVNFLAGEIMPWAFLTQRPFDVLDAAKELGYPVRYDDRIP
ncbi:MULTISPECIES: hypothetical protein [Arthrobacter]|uniref:Uncharacterized protein n=1 Tax=Arthrobacter terricola TaxID=2547396 RepID=A0A4R5KAZ7_9MICC|nr:MULTISPECIES: hypothetical protein [Arthrobacter]MBT8162631.1 hypothetical protein [Arthrobacter sp. GN70]TDF92413.1 hypothetical protein E1809_17880 [Arthrobacter terricola]